MRETREKSGKKQPDDIRVRHMKRQKKKRLRKIFFRTLFLLILLGLALGIVIFLTPWFHINEIQVSGNSQVSREELIYTSGIYTGNNIFKVNLGQVKSSLEQMPYIEQAEVKRILPDKISIVVTESHQAACILYLDRYAILDENGEVLDIVVQKPENLLEIKGITLAEAAAGQKVVLESEDAFDIITTLIDKFEERGIMQSVTSLDVAQPLDIKFSYENRLLVYLGDISNLEWKFLMFEEIAMHQQPPNAKGEIDLRIDGQGSFRP